MSATATSPETSTRRRILVVEDDPAIVTMLRRVLEPTYQVTVAVDGMDGLSAALHKPEPDLIITDVMMPRLDGYTMIARLRKTSSTHKIPVIFLTAKGDPKSVVTGITVGARHYVTKPFRVDDLLDKVRKSLGSST